MQPPPSVYLNVLYFLPVWVDFEVEYREALGLLVGAEGRGVQTIVEMVHHTRLDCALGSAGGLRRSVAVAVRHARGRSAFGFKLAAQPLMEAVLADLCVESEAATLLALRTAAAFDGGSGGSGGSGPGFARLLTAIAKYFICKQQPLVAYEVNQMTEC